MPGPKVNFVCGPLAAFFYVNEKRPLTEIAKMMSAAISSVRQELLRNGIQLRTIKESLALVPDKLSARMKGKKRGEFGVEWRNNIRKGRIAWSDKHANGFSKKPSGYIEHTRGINKGRSQHVTLMEQKIGRSLRHDEVVHHKDHNRSNNNLDNLELMSRSEHCRHHAIEKLPHRKRKENGRFS